MNFRFRKLLLIFLPASFIVACQGNHVQDSTRPNIIFIMSDDHAAQAVSCYNDELVQTPNIDRIANQGVLFRNAFVTNSICAPSRATILTGKYSHKNGVLDNKTPFDTSQVTFPKLLQNAGYQTALVGKWHLKSQPSGFDYWHILPGQGDYNDPVMVDHGDTISHKGYVTDIVTDLSLRWLDKRDTSKPFCLLTQFKAAHTPNIPPDRYKGIFEGRKIPLPDNFYDDYEGRKAAQLQHIGFDNERAYFPLHYRDIPDSVPEEKEAEATYQVVMQDYLAVVKGIDENVGRIMQYLQENDLEKNTIVIYTSDQGFFLGEHGWFNKRFMYEESITIPLVMQYPDQIKAGTVIDDMVLNLDFGPTFLDYAGAAIPEAMQGRSFKNIINSNLEDISWREAVYYHYYDLIRFGNVQKHYGVRTDRYKLIHFYEVIDEWEMYDLKKDPNEMNNIYNKPDYELIQQSLHIKLSELIEKYDDQTIPPKVKWKKGKVMKNQ